MFCCAIVVVVVAVVVGTDGIVIVISGDVEGIAREVGMGSLGF